MHRLGMDTPTLLARLGTIFLHLLEDYYGRRDSAGNCRERGGWPDLTLPRLAALAAAHREREAITGSRSRTDADSAMGQPFFGHASAAPFLY